MLESSILSSLPRRSTRGGRERAIAFGVAVALHAAAVAALLSYQPVREALVAAAPVMVSLVAPPRTEVAPAPEPPKPKPVVQPRVRPAPRPVEPPRIVAAPSDAPADFAVPVPPAQPASQGDAAPGAAPVAAAPAAIVPPRFNADYLQNPAPPYPALARRMGEQGRVVLRVLVSPAGLPEKVELRTSSGSPRLDQSALETVRSWKFVPARQGDQPVAAWVLVPISFTLQG